jgi:hypothetical protein
MFKVFKNAHTQVEKMLKPNNSDHVTSNLEVASVGRVPLRK